MSDQDYESSATPNNNAENSNLQPMGMYEAAATPVQQRPESAPRLAKLSAEDYASIIDAPLTGEEVALKIAKLNESGIEINSSTIDIDEFKAYDDWRKKQHFDFWGAVGDGIAQTGKDLGKGVASAATDWKKLALATGLSAVATPAVGFSVAYGMTALEGFWRGTRDLGGLFVMAANHPSSPLYRMFINPSGDVNQSYQDFLDLSQWNAQSEKIIQGKTNALMPDRATYEKLFGKAFGNQVDDFIGVNKELATAASYVLDPTVFFTFGASSASKAGAKAIANKAAAAALKSGQANGHLAGSVAARAARNTMKTTYLNSLGSGMVKFSNAITEPLENGYQWLTKNIEKITGGAHVTASGQTRFRRISPSGGHGPTSFTHATMGALGAYSLFSIPYAVPVASVYGGLKAIGYAGEALAAAGSKKALTAGAATVAKGLEMSTPVALYFKDLAKTTVHGSVYGGLIGGFAGGEEGAAGGIGTGMALGAIGHNVALASGTISGKFAKMDQIKKFEDRVKHLEEKGHLLKAKNMKKFVDDIRMSYGDDESVRVMGHLLGLEGSKNSSVAFFTPEDMKNAWMSDPDYWVEVDDGKGGKKKVLTELGEEIKRNADRGGRAWNGLFMEVDPKTGKSIETPILHYKDKKSGRYHVVINTEAMKFARNPDGTLRYKTVTEMVKTRIEKRVVDGEQKVYGGVTEGARPRVSPLDPTVPRGEGDRVPAPEAKPEATPEAKPEAAATEDVNVGDEFTAPARRTGTKEQTRRRIKNTLAKLLGEGVSTKYAEKADFTKDKDGNYGVGETIEENKGKDLILDENGNINDTADKGIRKELEKLTPAERLEVIKEYNDKVDAFKKKRKDANDRSNAARKKQKEKLEELGSEGAAEIRKKNQGVEEKLKKATEIVQDRNASKEERANAQKEVLRLQEIRNELNKADEIEAKARKDAQPILDEFQKEIDTANADYDKAIKDLRVEALVDDLFDIITDVDVGERQKWYDAKLDEISANPERQAQVKALVDARLKAEGFMSKDGKFETTKKQSAQTVAAAAETARKNAKYEAKWESNKDGSSAIKDKSGKLGGTVYKQYNAWWYADENGNGFGQQFKSEAEAKAFAENRLQTILEEKAFADSQPHSKETKNSLVQSEQAVNTDGTVDIVYGFNHHNNKTNKFTKGRAKARIVEGGGRKIVIKNINGVQVPFYCSTGEGGKVTVEAGKWYPFFGVSEKGWINKLSEADINDYYGSPDLKKAAQELDASLGDIREKKGYPQIGTNNEAAKTLNKEGKWGVEKGSPDTYNKVKANVEALKVELEQAAKNAPQAPKPTAEAPKPTAEAPKPTAEAPKPVATRTEAPALKTRSRKSVEAQGPGKPLTVYRNEPKYKSVFEEGPTLPIDRKIPIVERVSSQALSELYHIMNRVRRRVDHGTEIDGVIRNWLFGDKEGVYSGAFNRDRKKITEFMVEAYNRLIGPRAGSETGVEWKKTIEEYEKTGKITEATNEAFEKFIEEVGETLFIGWESGKPFDFILKGGDLGTVRNFVEALKDTWANHVERTAVNLGADINTKQAFFDWFKKNKAGGKFKFDPYIEQAFTDLVRVYADKGMKNNGRSYANVYTMPPAAVKDHIEQYQLEEYVTKDKDGNFKLKPLDQVHRERHEAGLKMADELAELAKNDPAALNGLDFIVFDDYYGVESPKIEGGIAEGLDALDRDSKSAFDPNTLQSKDTMAFRGGVLFSSGDMADIGPSLDDIVKAQVSRSKKNGIYKDRGFETFGARGRPRTTPTAKMALTMKQALARGKTLVFRGIPTEKAFAIIEKYVPKSVSKNVRAIAPVIADGGHTSSNVMRSTYLGFEQSQSDGTILYREMGHQFNAREVNYVPYDMEFRITLKNPKNPQVNYKQPHFAFLTRIFDMDALNNRTHRLWNESPELRNAYDSIDAFITDVHSTIDEYSGSGMIPAVKFFGADEYAREKRMFVMAAIGASPSNRVKTEYGHSVYTVAEADWHELQHKNKMGANMHPWKSLRLDNMRDIASIPDESMHVRVSQQQYRRSQVPTPTTDESSLYDASYSAPDGPIELIVENLKDYHETSGTGEYNHVNVIKGINDPIKLVKRLQKAPESNFETPKAMFNAADTFGGVDPEEIKFLKSNYQWAVSQGDIFLAESMKRYMAQFDKNAILIRHTLEEHLNAGGTIEEYNREIKTGVPVVFPVQHGTGSEAFLRDPVFKPEFLGKTTRAESAKLGYFFAGLQETANSYSSMAGFRPFKDLPEGLVIATDVHVTANDMRREFGRAIKAMAKRGDTYEQIIAALRSLRSNHKTNIERAAKAMGENSLVPKFAQEAQSINTSLDRTIYSKVFSAPLIKAEMELARLKADTDLIDDLLMDTGYDFNTLLEDWKLKDLDNTIRDEAWDSIQDSLRMEQKVLDAEGLGKSKRKPITKEQFDAYWYQQQSEFRVEQDVDSLDFISSEWNRYFHPEIKASRMMRSFVGFKNPYVYDFKGQGRSAGPRFSQIYKTALANGHDGIILQNIHDRGPNDNIVSIAVGNEKNIAVTDTSLSDTPAPRNSGYKEGGKYLHSAGDVIPEGAFGPNNPETVVLSRNFKKAKGFNADEGNFITRLNIDKSFKVGMAYEQMKHDPFNPKVREAYQQFAKETLEQFEHILEAGYRPQMHQFESEPYASSRQAIASIRDTKTLKVLSTDLNFGQRKVTDADIKENPLLAMTKYKDINGVPMRVNDVFRFVHDFFGHSERGNSFGPLGEENAWDVHARMYSPNARRAMTAGTRGQNSWVNFVHGENIEINRKRDMARRLEREGKIAEAAEIRKTIPKTTFAQQKIGLLPEWASKFDDQLTPIEREMYGMHEVRKSAKGMFSSGDNADHVWSPDAEEFAIRGAEARASSKFGTSVEIKNPEDYKGYDLFMIGEGRAMASVSPDGELGSVLKGINGTSEDVVRVVETALASGKVRWLNAFDTVLPNMYQKYGFEAVARLKFVDEYRPDGWNYELYNKFNGGRPDVVFMAYVGPEATSYKFFKGVEVATYDEAVALTHSRVEEGKGMFSASDLYDFEDFTDQTKDNIELVRLVPEYADKVRILNKKVELGELTQAQMNFQLNQWHKDNKTGNTAKSWETFNVGGEKVNVADMTTLKVEELVAEVKKRDPNYKKFAARAMKSEADRAIAEAEAVKEQLQAELDASKEAPEGETRLQMIKRIRRSKTLASGLTMLQRVREWNDQIDADTAEKVARELDKQYDRSRAEKEKNEKLSDKLRKLRERMVDKILLRYAEENEAAEIAGEELPHKGDDDVLRNKALIEAERDEATVYTDEDEIATKLEESKLSKEEYDKINKLIKQQTRGGETLIKDENGDIRAVYDQEIDEDMYEALLDDGVDEPKAWKAARNSFLEKTHADLQPLTLEEAIAEIKAENLEHAKENDGEVLWSPNEIEKEAMTRVNTRQMIIDATSGVKEVQPFANVRKGTYEYMAKVQFANTEYYDGEGNSIMWKGDKSGKIYKGLKVNEKDKSNKSTGNVFIGGELVEEGVSPVYPPEQEAQINEINQRVRDMLDGVATGRGEYKDKLLTVLDLFRLWGYEVNKNLFDNTFVARRSLIREEGLKGQALTREVFEARGDLITAYDVEAVWTERLDAMPDLYNTITELLKDIYAGAEFSKKQALDIWVDGMTRKGRRPTDAEIKAKEEFFQNADSDIEISELLVEGFIREFMKEGNYALSAEDLVTKGDTDAEKYFRENIKDKRKGERDKLRRKIAKETGVPFKEVKITDEQRAQVDAIAAEKVRAEAKSGRLSFPSKFFGTEESLEALIFTKLWNRNEEIKAAFKKMTGPERRKDRRQFRTSEGLRSEAISQAKNIRYKFIQYLFNATNPIIFEIAAEHAEKSGMVEKTPEGVKKDPKQVESERRAILLEEAAKAHEETAPVAQTPVEPVVPKPTTATPAPPTYKDSPAQREKDRNKDALAAAIAKADAEGKSTPVTGIKALAAAIGGQPSQPKPSTPKQTPQQLGYKVTPDNLKAQHPSGRFAVEKKGGIYEVVEMSTVGDVRRVNVRGVFKSFADAHKFIEEKITAQTPPPAPVGRPSTPKTPEPVKKAIEAKEKEQIETNTAKPPAEVGKAQAVVVNQGLAALDPVNNNAVAHVLQIDDNLTLKTDQLTNKTATTADKRYTATRTRTGIRVVMNAHIDPVTKQQVKGKKIGDVQTAEQAQLLIREFDFKQRRLLEQQGVDVAGQLQAGNPVLTPVQVNQAVQTVVADAQSKPPVPPVVSPQSKAETHPMFTTAVAALSTMGVNKTDAKERVKKAIEEIGFNADLQAILKHAFTQGAPAAQRIANSNATHAATVAATGNAPVTPVAAATVVIMPTVAGTQSATGGSVPSAPNVGVPPAIKTPPATAPALSAQRLSYMDTAVRFIPRKSMYVLSSGVQTEGVTYTNALGYMIVQSGISKWRAFNPAAALISVTDNEQEAVDAILREVFKR